MLFFFIYLTGNLPLEVSSDPTDVEEEFAKIRPEDAPSRAYIRISGNASTISLKSISFLLRTYDTVTFDHMYIYAGLKNR